MYTRNEPEKIFSNHEEDSVYYDVIMAGFGGQGIQIISQVLVVAAINKGLEVTYLPSYGVEKRGGRTNVTVMVSDEEIGSPVTGHPCAVIAMDKIALDQYQDMVQDNGLLIANTSLIDPSDIKNGKHSTLHLKCNEEAVSMGNPRLANMLALGALLTTTSFINFDDISKSLEEVIFFDDDFYNQNN